MGAITTIGHRGIFGAASTCKLQSAGILAIALLFSLPAYSQKPFDSDPLRPKSPVSKGKAPGPSQSSAPIDPLLGTEEHPLVVKSIEAERSEARLRQDKMESREANQRETDLLQVTIASALIASIAALVSILQVAMFWRQLRLMKESVQDARTVAEAAKQQVSLTRDEFEASHRPWVKCKVSFGRSTFASVPTAVEFDQSGMYVSLRFKLTNTGTAPALYALPHWKVVVSGVVRPGRLVELQRELCEQAKSAAIDRFSGGIAIFPNDSTKIECRINVPCSEIQAEIAVMRGTSPEFPIALSVYAVGCIDYCSALDRSHHQTGFAYCISAT